MIQNEVDDDAESASMSLGKETIEVCLRSVIWIDSSVIRDVVAMVTGGGVNRHQPEPVHPELHQVIELRGEPSKVSHPITVHIRKAAHEDLVKDVIPPPPAGQIRPSRLTAGGGRNRNFFVNRRPGSSAWGLPGFSVPAGHERSRETQDAPKGCERAFHGHEATAGGAAEASRTAAEPDRAETCRSQSGGVGKKWESAVSQT